MKRILALILMLCLLLGALPMQALAYLGDIFPASGTVKQVKLDDGSLSLQNEYIHVTMHTLFGQYSYITVVPAAKADEDSMWISQTPYCNFFTYDQGKEKTEGVVITPETMEFVKETPNGNANAIKVEYSLLSSHSLVAAKATVYYELVQLKEHGSAKNDTWGVLASVSSPLVDEKSMQAMATDFGFRWGFSSNSFTATGHRANLEKPGGPAIKMSRTTVPETEKGESPQITTESVVFTAPVEKLDTRTIPKGYRLWGEIDGVYTTEVYVDSYPWANPFVGLSDYYSKEIVSSGPGSNPIRVDLPQYVSVQPGDKPLDTWVQCESHVGFDRIGEDADPSQEYVPTHFHNYLWGFRDLTTSLAEVTEPDAVDPAIYAKRLAAFANGDGVTVEYVADDAALAALKKQYGNPVAIINGDYESKNGTDFTFTGGAALLSPSVTATWGDGGKLVIKKDGTIEHSGLNLNAPSFKFYQPNGGSGKDLKITLTKDGFTFDINPVKNDAIVYVDIPYAKVELMQATADAAGNLVFTGEIGFQTIFNGLEFTMEKLGYGLNGKHEFKVNGVHATGSFDTAKLMALELASVNGEVNTFKGEELYAFELELNAFDLFETEAELALTRSKNDGSLIPDALWFYVKGNPGIPLIPPIPIGQLNGGGAGFKDLAKTVNGDYFAIPPLKLRGALTGTYLHLIEGTGNIVLGPSEISLTATDVKIVGTGASIIKRFGYSLKLNGQKRTYGNETYTGVYFGGSEELVLHLPNDSFDVIVLDSGVELGAFGGANENKNRVYLGVGANGTVKGRVQIPSDVPFAGGFGADVGNINLIIGGQTTFPIKNSSVNESMKQAFNNMDIYLGAMVGVNLLVVDTRAWVLIPNIIKTNFRRGEGWGIEYRWLKKLPEWDWRTKGVEPVVQTVSLEDGAEDTPVLYSAEPFALYSADVQPLVTPPPTSITVNAGEDETPYILLAFDKDVTEEEIKSALSVTKENSTDPLRIYWVNETEDKDKKGHIDTNYEINAATDVMNKVNGEQHRVVLLRLPTGAKGTYRISTQGTSANGENALSFTCEQASTAPFEKLALQQRSNTLTGKVKYPAENTSYVLRTYLGTEPGGADYLIDERDVTAPYNNILFDIPTKGTLAPTGEYYVTSFLMTEKSTTFTDESGATKTVTGLVGIDSQQFTKLVSYRNTNQPDAPTGVTLELAGNEVMTAKWDAVEGAAGYAVTIYQLGDNGWGDTGFGYDVDGNTKSIDMALTVGGAGTAESPNLSADKTYKVGVRAYKTIEGGKYYSAETQSDNNGVFLPKYTQLNISLAVNGVDCAQDEHGVFHAYVGGSQSNMLAVSCITEGITEGITYKVTRMDTNAPLTEDGNREYQIPDFSGTLMLKIDGIRGLDVTSVFLLVSRDETAPVLTLSDPIFYADRNTGAYQITGTADAGSEILYVGSEPVYAAGDGSFTISGTLEEDENNSTFSLCAQDSAGNRSAFQLALVARQPEKQPDPSDSSSGGSYTPAYPVETPEQTPNGTITVSPKSASKGTTVTITAQPDPGYELGDLVVADEKGGLLKLTDKGAGKFTFTMPDGKVKLSASFRPQTPAFRDVSPSAWYAAAVNYVFAKGLMNGTGNDMFSPNADTTRGMIVTILARLDGQDTSGTPWYAAGQRWAMEHEISDGTKMTSAITREQMVTMLYRFAKAQGMDTTQGGMAIREYEDFEEISAYAVEAMTWAVNTGLIRGTGNRLLPKNTCTRAQAAMMLYRLLVTGA